MKHLDLSNLDWQYIGTQPPPETLFDRGAYAIALRQYEDEEMAKRAAYEVGYWRYFGELPDDARMIESCEVVGASHFIQFKPSINRQ